MFAELTDAPARERLVESLARPAHAYILSGPHDSEAEDGARLFAAALLGVEPRMLEVGHPDYVEEKPEGVLLRLEQVERLWHDIHQRPFSAGRRVYVLWSAEAMSDIVQQALLKSIEEPPDYAVVLLVTALPHRLLPTVRSRCAHIEFRHRPARDGSDAEGEEAYVAIARAAVRDPDFDASDSAETIADRSRKRGAAEKRAAEKQTKELIASLGDDPPKRELSRLEREGRDLARRRERVGQLAETRAAVAAFAEWYRDVVAESVGATGALVHSDRRAALEEDVRDGLAPVAERALAETRETLRTLDTLTLTPALAVQGLLHRIRLEASRGRQTLRTSP